MVTIIICVAVAVIIGFCVGYFDDLGGGFGGGIVGGLLGLMVGGIVGALSASVVGSFFETRMVEYGHDKLVSINDSITTSGSFFLGSGTIDGKLNYFYYREVRPGVIEGDSVPADSSSIILDGTMPRVVHLREKFVDPAHARWGLICGCSGGNRYEIHVPNGSVKPGFTFDLK